LGSAGRVPQRVRLWVRHASCESVCLRLDVASLRTDVVPPEAWIDTYGWIRQR